MIKFLRQIRKKLLSQNRFSKYLFYAIGEIVLVVIGILIALSINNWNTTRIDLRKVEKYLSEVKNNILADVAKIDTLTSFNSIKVKSLKRAVFYYYKAGDEPIYLDSIRAFIINGRISYISDFKPSKSGINALIGSGDISLISDSLRIELNKYYELINENSPTDERASTITRNIIQEKLFKQVVDKTIIEDFIEFDIPFGKVQPKHIFKPDNDIPADLMFLTLIVDANNEELNEIKQMGLEIIKTLENLNR